MIKESIMTKAEFESRVRYKLRGWYSKEEYETMAVERISKLRDEFHSILADVGRPGIPSLLDFLDECGFYYRPSSDKRHHNYPGGLAEHCMGVYKKMLSYGLSDVSDESIKLVGLFHDLCKCDMFYFVGRRIHSHRRNGHGSRSVRLLRRYGVSLSPEEYRAIRYHMGSSHNTKRLENPEYAKAVKETLRKAVSQADHEDAAEACARARRK